MMGIIPQDFWEMGGYAGYVWPAYGLAAAMMLWLLWRAHRELRAAEIRLKQLQSAVSPASERDGG